MRCRALVCAVVCGACWLSAAGQEKKPAPPLTLAALQKGFRAPPPDARITMHWWWVGDKLELPELKRELAAMKAAGVGGVEVEWLLSVAAQDVHVPRPRGVLDDLAAISAEASASGLPLAVCKGEDCGTHQDEEHAAIWTALGSVPFAATPSVLKADADRALIAGASHLTGFGWPYAPLVVAEPGWAVAQGAAVNDHDPWWAAAMPELTRYLARLSFLAQNTTVVRDAVQHGEYVAPALTLDGSALGAQVLHRVAADGDVFFVANEADGAVQGRVRMRSPRAFLSVWDATSGAMRALDATQPELSLAARQMLVLVASDKKLGVTDQVVTDAPRMLGDLTRGWTVRFPALGADAEALADFDAPQSWSADKRTRAYAGVAVYAKTVTLREKDLSGVERLTIEFGDDANVAGALRDVAVVRVNGEDAGVVWAAPYAVDVTRLLHAGDNTLEVRLASAAVNAIAALPEDARLGAGLVRDDGKAWTPQPAGIVGPVRLMVQSLPKTKTKPDER